MYKNYKRENILIETIIEQRILIYFCRTNNKTHVGQVTNHTKGLIFSL